METDPAVRYPEGHNSTLFCREMPDSCTVFALYCVLKRQTRNSSCAHWARRNGAVNGSVIKASLLDWFCAFPTTINRQKVSGLRALTPHLFSSLFQWKDTKVPEWSWVEFVPTRMDGLSSPQNWLKYEERNVYHTCNLVFQNQNKMDIYKRHFLVAGKKQICQFFPKN